MKKLLKMLLASLITITLVACGSGSVDWWSATGIGSILPIPAKGNGEVYSDTADHFNAYVEDVDEGDFTDYVDACIEAGFDVDSDASTDDYFAYNEDGLELTLYYYDGEYSISLESSKVDSTYTWPTSGLGTLLPEPKSNIGTITADSSNSFTIYVGGSTEEDISNYIDECIKAGFDVDYSKDTTSLYAYNEAGISITINDRGFNIMYVSLYGDDDEVAEALGKSTDTSIDLSESSDSSTSSSSGIRDEFKEAMDSYEDFFDEYMETKSLNQKNIDKIELKYNSEFPIIIKKIISTNQKPTFLDNEFRVLSYSEILNANKQLGVDFISLHLIPIIDCYNNDFICYNFKIKKWCMFNVIDECIFNERKDLKDYF